MPNVNKKPKETKKKTPAPKPKKPKKHDITKIPGFKFGKGTI